MVRIGLIIAVVVFAAIALFLMPYLDVVAVWAVDQQRGFQNQIANAVRALKSKDPGAYLLLLSASAAYGFVHALGPGHGKYLVGGVGLGSTVTMPRLAGIAVASSLVQAFWAIILVYGGFFLLETTARQLTDLTELYLAPASYLAIAAVGSVMIWRGMRGVIKSQPDKHSHTSDNCSCAAHGPTPDALAEAGSLRKAILLILSVGVRPCTGAVFLLVIAWQMDLLVAGIVAVIMMGMGTAALTGLVAVSSIAARRSILASSRVLEMGRSAFFAVQVFAGLLIVLFSLSFLGLKR